MSQSQPNIIWIYCDELRADAVGCFPPGTMRVPTPNLDRLAASGTRFNNCFCNAPVCVPSRVCTLTARYPEQQGVYNNEGAWPTFRLPVDVTTFPQHFASAGYATGTFGKSHVTPDMTPWQHENQDGGGMGDVSQPMPRPVPHNQLGGSFPADIDYPPNKVTDNALAWIDAQTGPYLARVSYLQPHTPLLPQAPFDHMFDDLMFEDFPDDEKRLSMYEQRWSDLWRERADEMPLEGLKQARRYYCGLVAWVDQQVGRILDHLEKTGQREQTVIAFSSDHGAAKAENHTSEKHTYAPFVHRVPMIVAHPNGKVPQGETSEELTTNIDLARTFCDLAGVAPLDAFEGRALFADTEPDAVFSTVGFGYHDSRCAPNGQMGDWHDGRGWPRRSCIRTRQYRLDMNMRLDGKEPSDADRDVFFVDVQADPQELWNIADRDDVQGVMAELRMRLIAHGKDAVEVEHALVAPSEERKARARAKHAARKAK